MMQSNFISFRNVALIASLVLSSFAATAQMDFATATSLNENKVLSESNSAILMMEQGTGVLVNGNAEIQLNPAMAALIDGDRIEDMVKVAIQLEGDSNGVYVTKKNKNSFVITELLEGESNANFSYEIIVQDI